MLEGQSRALKTQMIV